MNAVIIAGPVEQAFVGRIVIVFETPAVMEDIIADQPPSRLQGGTIPSYL
ncbi:MAG: hypothetical protein GY807_23650 [Gammaproteobacteria bacterium]|nr:hypothetical protein [Gammaproteobacteria bacterium]